MSHSDTELNKYRILMTTVIFMDSTQLIFEKFHCKCYPATPSTSLVVVEWAIFSMV